MRSWVGLAVLAALPCGCAQWIGLDDYEEARLANGAASFDTYRFRSGAASFRVAASGGLLANEGDASRVLSTGPRITRRGGVVELAQDGSFTYTPPGSPGAFWGDDVLDFSVQRGRLQDDAAQARLTVQPLALDMSSIPANPGSGFALYGAMSTRLGVSPSAMASAGDFNGDGREDLVLGLPGLDLGGRGAYIAFGKTSDTDMPLADIPNVPGVKLIGPNDGDRLGTFTAAGIGDVNGDGFDDVSVGAPGVADFLTEERQLLFLPDTRAGRTYVLYGRPSSASITTDELIDDPTLGFYLEGGVDGFGIAVAGAGDVNGDGFADVIVGAPYTSPYDRAGSGAAYVIFGGPDLRSVTLPAPGTQELTGGFVIGGARELDLAGALVGGVGDVNGDGLDDVLVGAGGASAELVLRTGAAYVVFGKRDTSDVRLLDLDRESPQGFKILGAEADDRIGNVAAAGDMNGDGLSDIALGAAFATIGAQNVTTGDPPGAAYVVFGKNTPGTVELAALESGRGSGYAIVGSPPLRSAGLSMSPGDLNSDGLMDLLIGTVPSNDQSKSYVVFGKPDTVNVELATLEVGEPGGFSLFGPGVRIGMADGLTGYGAIAGSDLNGDGLDDMVVGADPEAAPEFAGGAYAIFGWDMSGALGARRSALIGTGSDDAFDLPDVPLIAARGGNGTDTLRVSGSGRVLDLRPTAPRFESIERIDLSGSGANTLILDESALRRTPATRPGLPFELAKTLTVLSDGDDTLYFDISGYRQAGAREGRLLYVHDGAYYGLEISPRLRVAWPPP